MHDQEGKLPVCESTDIPLFYLGGDLASQRLTKMGAAHGFHGLNIERSMVRQLRNPYSLRCMAEYFAKVIRENRPTGPYMLGGGWAHGVLALETAQILREQHQDVALLVLLETINPERVRQQIRLTRIMAKMNLFGREHKYLRSLPQAPPREIQLTQSTPLEILCAAVRNYQPRPYDSPVLLIRSRPGVWGLARDRHLGWGETLGTQLDVCESEGNMYADLERLVAKARESLKHAEQRWQEHLGGVGQMA